MPNLLAGIKFPFQNFGDGTPGAAFGTDVIRYALIVLLRTKKRTRVMRPTVGTNLHKLIFEDQGPVTQSLIIREIASAIASQLPQVRIQRILFTEEDHVEHVNVQYSVQGVSDQTGFIALPKG